jgi:hypothetical protein
MLTLSSHPFSVIFQATKLRSAILNNSVYILRRRFCARTSIIIFRKHKLPPWYPIIEVVFGFAVQAVSLCDDYPYLVIFQLFFDSIVVYERNPMFGFTNTDYWQLS